jgi:hypothetical protein
LHLIVSGTPIQIYFIQADMAEAKELLYAGIRQFQRTNVVVGLARAMEVLASLFVHQNQPVGAAPLFAWADTMRKKLRFRQSPIEQKFIDNDLETIRKMIGDSKFAELSAQGRAMTMEEAIALALEETPELSSGGNEVSAGNT